MTAHPAFVSCFQPHTPPSNSSPQHHHHHPQCRTSRRHKNGSTSRRCCLKRVQRRYVRCFTNSPVYSCDAAPMLRHRRFASTLFACCTLVLVHMLHIVYCPVLIVADQNHNQILHQITHPQTHNRLRNPRSHTPRLSRPQDLRPRIGRDAEISHHQGPGGDEVGRHGAGEAE